jgi:hypothetical protein
MLAIFMTLIRTATQTEAGAMSDEREPAAVQIAEAGQPILDPEALLVRLGLPREFTA